MSLPHAKVTMEITLIAAVDEGGVIGVDGEMPWHYPADLERFKRLTMGHPVIMGRVTYESIVAGLGGPLPGRTSVVLTRSPDAVATVSDGETDGSEADAHETVVRVATSVEEALGQARETGTDEVFVAGGATVYAQFLPRADRLELTEIHASYDGDTWFPDWDREEWTAVSREDRDDLSFVTYERVG